MLVTMFAQFISIFVPQKIAEFLAVIFADAFRPFDWRTKAVMKNMNIIFPEKPLYERKRLTRDTFRKMFLSYVKLMKINREKWEKMMSFEDLEIIKNRKSLVFSIHLGPWDIGCKYVNAYGFNIYALMEDLPKFYMRLWQRFREGIKIITVGKGTLKAIRQLKKEEKYAIVLLIDRVTSGKYYKSKFMGQDVIFAEGIFKLPNLIEGDSLFLQCHWDEKMEKVHFDFAQLPRENLEGEILRLFEESIKKYPTEWYNFYFFTTQKPI
ncbi:MAG TPA: hypothetical protein PKU94_03550 [Candidatus Hydrothermia bacterium]|nr:hypothetical protein [Candidatus Hydrothermia bacterium]